MFVVNEDNSIYCTRGDTVRFDVKVSDVTVDDLGDTVESFYSFKDGDVIRFTVYRKKNCEDVVIQKVFPATPGNSAAEIVLTKVDTSKFDFTSKPKDYWYDVELINGSGTYTIIGYDEDGAKVFKVFPEGDVIEEDIPETPSDVVDVEISLVSKNPVQNRAVALELFKIYDAINKITDRLEEIAPSQTE